MSIYQAGALAIIITGGIALLLYGGIIIAEVIKYKARRRRFERGFER